MADKIAARKQLARERGYTDEQWNQKGFKRAFKPYTPASKRQLGFRQELFREWVREEQKADPDSMFSYGAELPPLSLIKNFLNFYVSTTKGRIFDKPTADTVHNACNCVTTYLYHQVGKKYPRDDLNDLYNYVINDLVLLYDLKYSEERKYDADELDLRELLEQHWLRDVGLSVFKDRILQYPLSVMLLYYLICRVGSVLKSTSYKDLGLKYKHVSIRVEEYEGRQRIFAVPSQTDMKGKKNRGHWVETALKQEAEFIHCPVILILALAFRKGAFADINGPEELFDIRPPRKDTLVTLPWKPEVLEEPLCDISDQTLRNWNKEVLARAGYKHNWRLYSIRYAMSNRLGDEPEVPKDRLMQAMGHFTPTEYVKSYQSRLVRVDIQGLVLRKQQDKTIDFAKFIRVERGSRPPDGIPYSMQKDIEERIPQSGLQGQPQYKLRRKLKEQARKSFVESWHKALHTPEGPNEPSANIPDSVELLGDLSDSHVQLKVKQRFSPTHSIILEACSQKDFRLQDNAALLRALIELPDQPDAYYYPDELPVRNSTTNGTLYSCPICLKDITHTKSRPSHIHTCICLKLWNDHRSTERPRYCYRCNIWFPFIDDYREHCRRHFDEIDMFCGLLHHQKVVFVSGRCPFCAVNETLPWEERMFEFEQTTHFSTHLEDHFAMLGVSTPCPHPCCNKANKYLPAELREHLQDVHSLKHTSRDQRGRPKMEGTVAATKIRRTCSEAMIGMVGSCEERIIDPLLDEIAVTSNQGLLHVEENIDADIIPRRTWANDAEDDIPLLKASPVSQTPACNSSDSSSITLQLSSTSMSMIASSCTTPVSTGSGAQSPTDYSGLATCIPFDPTSRVYPSQAMALSDVPGIACSQPTREIPPITSEGATVGLASSKHAESSKKRRLSVAEKFDVVTGDTLPHGNIAASIEEESATALALVDDHLTGESPTDSHSSLGTALPFELQPVDPESRPKRPSRRQPTRATPPRTRQRARLEAESRVSKRRRT